MSTPSSMLGIPFGVPPEDYQSYLKAQRMSMLAQALTGQAASPVQAPETAPVRGLYVQPRVGIGSIVGKLGQALLANRMTNRAMQAQSGLMGAMSQAYAPGGQQVLGTGQDLQPSAPVDPNEQTVDPGIKLNPGQSFTQTVDSSQPQFTPPNPRNPQNLPADVVARLAMTDPKDYAQMLAGPPSVQLARIAGVDPETAARAQLTKDSAITLRPGGTMIDPISGRAMLGADPAKGEYYAMGPDGQVHAFPITNDATIQAIRAGMTTAEQQANTPREIPMGGGVSRLGYAPTPPILRGSQGPAAGAPQVAPTPQNAPSTASASPQPPAPPAASQGVWSTIPKLQIPNTPGQTSNTFEQKVLEDAAEKHQELVNTYGQEAKLADQQLQYNKWAMQALPSADVGPLSGWLTKNRAMLQQLGVPASMIPDSGSVTPTYELNKDLTNAALQGAKSIYGPRMSQMEVRLQKEEASPSVTTTRDAIAALMAQQNIMAQYQKQRAADYGRYRSMGGDPQQFESWYAQNRPLTRFAGQQMTPPAALARLKANPHLLPDFVQMYGWDPTK